jgi:hypothetical protein
LLGAPTKKSALMKSLCSRAVVQSTLSSPLRMARRRRMALPPSKKLVCCVDAKQFKIKKVSGDQPETFFACRDN